MNAVKCIDAAWKPEFEGPNKGDVLTPIGVCYDIGNTYYRFKEYPYEYDSRSFVELSSKTIEQVIEETVQICEPV